MVGSRARWPVILFALLCAPFPRGADGADESPGDLPPTPPLTPAAERDSFSIAPGFRVELVAAEPLVESPVAMAFDADGRLFVVEMRGFMPNAEGRGEDAPTGRVSVLEDR